MVCQTREKRFLIQKQRPRRHHRPAAIALEQVVARLRIAPEVGNRRRHIAMQQHPARRRQVIKQRGRVFKKQRQKILHPRRGNAVRHIFVNGRPARVALKSLAEAAAKACAARLVERKLPRRQQADLIHRIHRALRVRVEGADGVDVVVKQINAVRQRRTHRKQIDDAAAHAVLTRAHHLRHMRIARQRHLLAKGIAIHPLAALHKKRMRRQKTRRCHAVQRRRRRHQHHIRLAPRNRIQRRQPLRHQILVRRQRVVRQRLPVRQHTHPNLRRKPQHFVAQPLRVNRIRHHHDLHRARAQRRDRQGVGGARERGQVDALAGLGGGQRLERGEQGVWGGHAGADWGLGW